MSKKTYKKLYKKDSTNSIRVWWAEQDDDKFCFFSGLDGGAIVQSKYTKASPKNIGKSNATTSVEQAQLEIEAKYTKKQKTGYTDDIRRVSEAKDSFVQPMLAKNYKNYSHKIDFAKENWIAQCKFNGMRCVAIKNGLFTRKGEEYLSVPHIHNSLRPFFKEYPDAVLDGELFNSELRQQLNEISKLVRKTKHITQEDLDKSKELVRFYIYDGYSFDGHGVKTPYQKRKYWLDKNVTNLYDYMARVRDFPIKNQKGLDDVYEAFVEEGHEGIILRNIEKGYENKRSKYLLKIKPEDDSEAIITDVIEGKGNWSGVAKTATLKWGDKIFDATFKGSQKQLKEVLENKGNWLDKEVTFIYNGLTGLKIPNFARIDINNCFKR